MMPERIGQPSLPQPVGLVGDRSDLQDAVRDRPRGKPIRISDQQVDFDRGEIGRLQRFIGNPETDVPNHHLGDDPPSG
jgi:hypothetical protein